MARPVEHEKHLFIEHLYSCFGGFLEIRFLGTFVTRIRLSPLPVAHFHQTKALPCRATCPLQASVAHSSRQPPTEQLSSFSRVSRFQNRLAGHEERARESAYLRFQQPVFIKLKLCLVMPHVLCKLP